MRIALTVVLTLLGVLVPSPSPGHAQTLILGHGHAADCSKAVLKGRFDQTTLGLCTLAIENDNMKRRDAAKTYVNRGVIYLRRDALDQAAKDLDSAERLTPDLAEIFVNRGAILMKQARWRDAIAQLDRGITLKSEEPEKAYFNRGLAREQVDDLSGAYADLKMAAMLKPDWQAPRTEMARYTVVRR
jgi:tetratricopeptide (TPR) repeat protein